MTATDHLDRKTQGMWEFSPRYRLTLSRDSCSHPARPFLQPQLHLLSPASFSLWPVTSLCTPEPCAAHASPNFCDVYGPLDSCAVHVLPRVCAHAHPRICAVHTSQNLLFAPVFLESLHQAQYPESQPPSRETCGPRTHPCRQDSGSPEALRGAG